MNEICLHNNNERQIESLTPTGVGVIEFVRGRMPEDELLYELAELFKSFGDTTRTRILCALFESEMCVGDISQLLGMTQSAISHQLRFLKTSRLVKTRREGKAIFYQLNDAHVKEIFALGLDHISE